MLDFCPQIFVNASTKADFNAALAAGKITSTMIVFIAETKEIYHAGIFYGGIQSGTSSTLQTQVDTLSALVTNLNDDVKTLKGTTTDTNSRLTTVESKVNTNSTRISNLTSSDKVLREKASLEAIDYDADSK